MNWKWTCTISLAVLLISEWRDTIVPCLKNCVFGSRYCHPKRFSALLRNCHEKRSAVVFSVAFYWPAIPLYSSISSCWSWVVNIPLTQQSTAWWYETGELKWKKLSSWVLIFDTPISQSQCCRALTRCTRCFPDAAWLPGSAPLETLLHISGETYVSPAERLGDTQRCIEIISFGVLNSTPVRVAWICFLISLGEPCSTRRPRTWKTLVFSAMCQTLVELTSRTSTFPKSVVAQTYKLFCLHIIDINFITGNIFYYHTFFITSTLVRNLFWWTLLVIPCAEVTVSNWSENGVNSVRSAE